MLKKKFYKTKCKVTFSIPEDIVADVPTQIDSVHIVGDFNDWKNSATPMNKKGKTFEATLDLPLAEEFQFRYLLNEQEWHNDWHADRYVPNPFGGDNSVVSTTPTNDN